MTELPAWARDPDALETIILEAIHRGDVESIYHALRLMVAVDPGRADDILIIVKLGLDVADAIRTETNR